MDNFVVWFDVWIFVTTSCRVGTKPCSVVEYGEVKLWGEERGQGEGRGMGTGMGMEMGRDA